MINLVLPTIAIGLLLAKGEAYEEALPLLSRARTVEQLFYKAVAEHQLGHYEDMSKTLAHMQGGLINQNVPERYATLANAMIADAKVNLALGKKSKLASASSDMRNAERRLTLRKSGKATQKHQEEALRKLKEEIDKSEEELKQAMAKANGLGQGEAEGKLKPLPGAGSKPSAPMPDSMPGGMSGEGRAAENVVRGMAKKWGALPEKERAAALANLTRELPPKHREAVQEYFRALARSAKP